MSLIHSFEKEGNFLFRYRGQIPVILFILAIPVIYFTDYSWMQENTYRLILILAVLVSLSGLSIRAVTVGTTPRGTSGRNTKNQVAEELNTSGIYSVVRHPLYVGNYLMWIGIVIFTFNIYFIVIVTLAYWLYYERIMFAEESFLESKFGEAFKKWSLQTPAFIPSFRNYQPSNSSFSMKKVFSREYSGFLATVLGFLFIEVLRKSFYTGELYISKVEIVILAIAVFITFALRSLKKYTKILIE